MKTNSELTQMLLEGKISQDEHSKAVKLNTENILKELESKQKLSKSDKFHIAMYRQKLCLPLSIESSNILSKFSSTFE